MAAKKKNTDAYTSVYLDADSRMKLAALATASGQNRSQVMRSLIQGADGEQYERLAKLLAELMDLVGSNSKN